MPSANDRLPAYYTSALTTLLRYAVAMAGVGLLVGIAFQESARKLDFGKAPAGLHLEAVLPLGLVHGHVFTLCVFLPLGMAGALVLALRAGGKPLGKGTLAWLTRGYLPFAAATVALFLFKGYVILLAVRHGATDMALVDEGFLGGSGVLRFAVYAVIHGGMGVTLGAFLWALWRSLGSAAKGRTTGE